MVRLLADTCVWLDFAENDNGESLIVACRQLIEEERHYDNVRGNEVLVVFTYNENRVLLVEGGLLTFPNKVNVRMEFDQNAALGDQVPGLTCMVGSKAQNT